MSAVSMTLRILVAAVLAAASIGKLRNAEAYREFVRSLFSVGVPRMLVAPLATTLVGTEIAASALLVWSGTAIAGAMIATALFVVLAVGLARAVRRGVTAHCRCFGVAGAKLGWLHVGRNAALVLIAAASGLTAVGAGAAPPGSEIAAAAALGLAAAVIVVFAEEIGAVLRHTLPQKGN